MKRTRSSSCLVAACVVTTIACGGGTRSAAPATPLESQEAAKHQAKVSMEEARKTALAIVPGTVKEEELEKENGRWIYSFEIKPTGERAPIVKEVNIDADTGKLVGEIETEKG